MALAKTIRDEARRRAKAQAEGFASAYERRVQGVPRGERARARGHRGTRDFLDSLREGDLILCDIAAVEIVKSRRMVMQYRPDRRFKSGRRPVGKKRVTVDVYKEVEKTVIPSIRITKSGKRFKRQPGEKTYALVRLTRGELLETIEEEERRGVIFSPSPSMDQRRLVSHVETEGGY